MIKLNDRTAKERILKALSDKPLIIGDLIKKLGYSLGATGLDVATNINNMLKPLAGSFIDSLEQKELGVLVKSGDVHYIRAKNMDNWYKLPHQKWPEEVEIRERSLKQIMDELINKIPDDIKCKIELNNISNIKDGDLWVEFCPFVLSAYESGWELADGDPNCNWCGNTFTQVYDFDVDVEEIIDKITSKISG